MSCFKITQSRKAYTPEVRQHPIQTTTLLAFFPRTNSELIPQQDMPPQSVRRVATAVVAQGWAHWQPTPGRRGQNLLVLTDKGRRAITALTAEQHAWADAVGQEIGERDLKTLATLISRVTEASRRYRQAAGEEPSP